METEDNKMSPKYATNSKDEPMGKGDWNEDVIAYLEQIEDHLSSIRRNITAITILAIVAVIIEAFNLIHP
jgi:hypothetical protein